MTEKPIYQNERIQGMGTRTKVVTMMVMTVVVVGGGALASTGTDVMAKVVINGTVVVDGSAYTNTELIDDDKFDSCMYKLTLGASSEALERVVGQTTEEICVYLQLDPDLLSTKARDMLDYSKTFGEYPYPYQSLTIVL